MRCVERWRSERASAKRAGRDVHRRDGRLQVNLEIHEWQAWQWELLGP